MEGGEEVKDKCLKSSLPKGHLILLYKMFIMEKCLRSNMKEQDVVRHVMEKVAKMFKNAKPVKEMEELCKCFRWVQVCISKFKNLVINVQDKGKLLVRVVNARPAKEKK